MSPFRRLILLLQRKLTGGKPLYHKESDQAYYQCDELGTSGRRQGTDIETRLRGMDFLLNGGLLQGASLLDAGCAEGLISEAFVRAGVTLVHGFELQDISVKYARQLFEKHSVEHVFRQADMSRWDDFLADNADVLKPGYDAVIFLSVYHHIVRENGRKLADKALLGLAGRARKYFVLRTTIDFPEDKILAMGFKKTYEQDDALENDPVRVYARQ